MARRLLRELTSDETLAVGLGSGFLILCVGSVILHAMDRPSPLDQQISILIAGMLGYLSRAQPLGATKTPEPKPPVRHKEQSSE